MMMDRLKTCALQVSKKLMLVKPEALAQQLKEMTAKQYSKEIIRL